MVDTLVASATWAGGLSRRPVGNAALHFQRRNKRWGNRVPRGSGFDKSGNLFGTTYLGVLTTLESFRDQWRGRNRIQPLWAGTPAMDQSIRELISSRELLRYDLAGRHRRTAARYSRLPRGTETLRNSFTVAPTIHPYSALVLGANNTFYSTTLLGGTSNLGRSSN